MGEFVANAFHEMSYLLTGSPPPAPSRSRWKEDRYHSEWNDEPEYDDYREGEAESLSPQEAPASRWRRALSIGLQAAGWWLARQVGRNPVVMATSLGVSAALLSYAGGPIVGVGLAGIAGALLHLLGLREAVEAAAVAGR